MNRPGTPMEDLDADRSFKFMNDTNVSVGVTFKIFYAFSINFPVFGQVDLIKSGRSGLSYAGSVPST